MWPLYALFPSRFAATTLEGDTTQRQNQAAGLQQLQTSAKHLAHVRVRGETVSVFFITCRLLPWSHPSPLSLAELWFFNARARARAPSESVFSFEWLNDCAISLFITPKGFILHSRTHSGCAKAAEAEVARRRANLYLGKIGHLIKTGRAASAEQTRAPSATIWFVYLWNDKHAGGRGRARGENFSY